MFIISVFDIFFLVLVNVGKVGLKFVNFVNEADPLIDEFVSHCYTLTEVIYNFLLYWYVNLFHFIGASLFD